MTNLINHNNCENEMDNCVATRLRASEARSIDNQYRSGHTSGTYWADNIAQAEELARLERNWRKFEAQGFNRGDWLILNQEDRPEARAKLDGLIRPINADSVIDFWKQALGEDSVRDSEDAPFVLGFAEGAMAVWADFKKSRGSRS